MKAYLIWQ